MERIVNFTATTLHRAFNGGRTYSQQQQHKRDIKLAEEKAEALRQRPPPLPSARLNISQSTLSLQPPSQTQPQCPLFSTLPPELRIRIWCEVLGNSVLHFTSANARITHRRSMLLFDSSTLPSTQQCTPRNLPQVENQCISQSLHLALLQTCHAIYAEAHPLLWHSNTITLTSPLTLLHLHDCLLPPSHWRQIQHLQFEWTYVANPEFMHGRYLAEHDPETWVRFWGLVGKMGLRTLGCRIEYVGPPAEEEGAWMEPMGRVRGVERAEVGLEALTRPREGVRRLEGLERELEERWMRRV